MAGFDGFGSELAFWATFSNMDAVSLSSPHIRLAAAPLMTCAARVMCTNGRSGGLLMVSAILSICVSISDLRSSSNSLRNSSSSPHCCMASFQLITSFAIVMQYLSWKGYDTGVDVAICVFVGASSRMYACLCEHGRALLCCVCRVSSVACCLVCVGLLPLLNSSPFDFVLVDQTERTTQQKINSDWRWKSPFWSLLAFVISVSWLCSIRCLVCSSRAGVVGCECI
mmetsp:Transcript_2181/g.6046  ORF Transcript_2181/g.6046 Transcript_2181/m.6046 type:complete len:226 (-) Transcript_2181:244-921(-)